MEVCQTLDLRQSYSSKVCETLLDDWANSVYVNGLLQVRGVVLDVSSLCSWSYSKECVWNSGKKLCCIVPRK